MKLRHRKYTRSHYYFIFRTLAVVTERRLAQKDRAAALLFLVLCADCECEMRKAAGGEKVVTANCAHISAAHLHPADIRKSNREPSIFVAGDIIFIQICRRIRYLDQWSVRWCRIYIDDVNALIQPICEIRRRVPHSNKMDIKKRATP